MICSYRYVYHINFSMLFYSWCVCSFLKFHSYKLSKIIYRIQQSIGRGNFSYFLWLFSPTTKALPCMFCMLVALIQYSDEMMALMASPQKFSSKKCFSCNHKSFPPQMFCCIIIVSHKTTFLAPMTRQNFGRTKFPTIDYMCLV